MPAAAFATATLALMLFTISEPAAGAAGLVTAALLIALGARHRGWRSLRWAFIVPAAAFAVDVLTFSPLSHQTGPEANVYTPIAVTYLPLWATLVGAGALARRLVLGRAAIG